MKLSALLCALTVCSSVALANDNLPAAREHYRNGTKLFDLGKYLDAAHEYEAAYTARDEPSLLFNIAQAYRLAGDKEAAVRAYKSFLRRLPEAQNRDAVEQRIAELQKAIEQDRKAKEGQPEGTVRPPTLVQPKPDESTQAPAPAPVVVVTTAPAPPPPVPLYKRWWLWTAVAAVVVVGVGVGVGVGVAEAPKNFGPTVKDIGPSASVMVRW